MATDVKPATLDSNRSIIAPTQGGAAVFMRKNARQTTVCPGNASSPVSIDGGRHTLVFPSLAARSGVRVALCSPFELPLCPLCSFEMVCADEKLLRFFSLAFPLFAG